MNKNKRDRKEYYPQNLLTRSSAKTIKGEKYGWETNILYLSPHKQNELGKNLCPFASVGCAAACLYTAGRGRFSSVENARLNKTRLFLTERDWFIEKLYKELVLINLKDAAAYNIAPLYGAKQQCVRLNGTSDIPWENIKYKGKNMFEHFPDLQYYDYSKDYRRVINNKHKNYHLTFSRSENNDDKCIEVLKAGHNVAAVFNKEFYNRNLYDGGTAFYSFNLDNMYKVIDGDQSDLRFLDKGKGVIVGLKAKGDANKDKTGFVI